MTFYSLRMRDRDETFRETARDRDEALSRYSNRFNHTLTTDGDGPHFYLMDEYEESPHQLNHTIPVYIAR